MNRIRLRSVRHATLVSVVIFNFVLVGCGLPEEGRFVALPASELPDALTATTSTSTTTSVPSETESTTTTVTEVLYDSVEFYFVSANRVVRSERRIVSPATPTQVLDTLFAGLDSNAQTAGLRSALPRGLTATIEVRRGVARVVSTAPFLSELEPLDQRLAIAQIVLTLTRRPGIGQVLFVVDDVEIQVPCGAGDLTAKGATVTYDDYLSVLSTRD
ncbi:MAG: GerMN domain-containing protein [Ilumatobacteraceae bacterium]